MTIRPPGRNAAVRLIQLAMIATTMLTLAPKGASASDGDGIGHFLVSILGIPAGSAEPEPTTASTSSGPVAQVLDAPRSRAAAPIRAARDVLSTRRRVASPRSSSMRVVARAGRTPILEDGTLRTGDAVMTNAGIRIYVGPGTLPHRTDEFVEMSRFKGLGKDAVAVLAAVDRQPRG